MGQPKRWGPHEGLSKNQVIQLIREYGGSATGVTATPTTQFDGMSKLPLPAKRPAYLSKRVIHTRLW